MRLYLLERKAAAGYDEYDAMLIRAISQTSARKAAAIEDRTDADVWLNQKLSTCSVVTQKGEAEIIITSFNAG